MLRFMLQPFRPEALFFALSLALSVPAAASADVVQSVLGGVNAVRAKAGCGPLKLNKALMATAEAHARNMAEDDFFGHRDKSGKGFPARVRAQGYRLSLAAENIAAGQKTPEKAVQAWLDSPSHRKNIMNCTFRETGIAMVYQPDDKPLKGQSMGLRYYWVQVFGVQR
jgi:uncharacterized protein YkwD